jgi:hypothetical protein
MLKWIEELRPFDGGRLLTEALGAPPAANAGRLGLKVVPCCYPDVARAARIGGERS